MTLIFKDLKYDNYERVLLAQDELTGFHSITATTILKEDLP